MMQDKIPFNVPYLTGNEIKYIAEAMSARKLSGNGIFTQRCQNFIENTFSAKKSLLTTSCTDALELAALLIDIKAGDEVILPSYTFVSSANAFVLRGAKLVFCDSRPDHPNLDVNAVESLITPRTRAIVAVHYGGFPCDMKKLLDLAKRNNIFVIEDAAQAFNVKTPLGYLGTIGHLGAYSFHDTKNFISGEGGALIVNHEPFVKRSEIIWEKGTNRSAFFRGEVNKYGWVDVGSSFLPSELIAAFLWAQLEAMEKIHTHRLEIFDRYYTALSHLSQKDIQLPPKSGHNGHVFFLVCRSLEERTALIARLKDRGIMTVFHYLSLHKSMYYAEKHDKRPLPQSDRYSDCLVRLPLYGDLSKTDQDQVIEAVQSFFE